VRAESNDTEASERSRKLLDDTRITEGEPKMEPPRKADGSVAVDVLKKR
jgi:hypothetical protein